MIITNSRYALVGYFTTSYPTQAHGIIVIYSHCSFIMLNIRRMQKWWTTRSSPGTSYMKLHESEVSQSLMFSFDNAFSEKSCFVVNLVPLFRPPYALLCSWMSLQQSGIFHSRESVLSFSFLICFGGETKETEAISLRSPKELLKFRLESILENV